MSTPTPITDAAEQTITIDCDDSCVSIYVYESDKIYEGGLVPSHASRRLELDRSALMEALEAQLEAERLEAAFNHVSMVIFMKDAFERTEVDAYKVQEAKEAMDAAKSRALSLRESALSAARANFPES